jgi:hypothetical protein
VDDLPFKASGFNERRVATVLVRHLKEPLPDYWVGDLRGETLRLLSLKVVVLFIGRHAVARRYSGLVSWCVGVLGWCCGGGPIVAQTAKAIAKVTNMKEAGIGFSLSMMNCDHCETSSFRISCKRDKQYSR